MHPAGMLAIVKWGKGDVRMSGYTLMPYGDPLYLSALCSGVFPYLTAHGVSDICRFAHK